MSSKAALHARPVASSEAGSWDRLATAHGSLFDTFRWTRLFEPGVRRIGIYDGGDNLRGGFCLFEQRRFGLRLLRNPPFTPGVGPFIEARATNPAARTSEQRAVVEAMAEYLTESNAAVLTLRLSLGISDCLPFFWRGYKVVPHYTYRINLAQDEAALFAAFSKERRNDVRKAQKDGITVDDAADTATMRSLVLETFARKDRAFPRQPMDTVFHAVPPGSNSFCLISRDHGHPASGLFVVYDSHTAYYLMGGYSNHAHHGAGALAIYHAILKAKALGLRIFDFEGSIIPPLERYFRGFGGRLTPIFGVHKAWLPLEFGLKLVRRQLF